MPAFSGTDDRIRPQDGVGLRSLTGTRLYHHVLPVEGENPRIEDVKGKELIRIRAERTPGYYCSDDRRKESFV